MSAHCDTHGCDLVYPPGTWPLGECRECVLEARVAALTQALKRIDYEATRTLTLSDVHKREPSRGEVCGLQGMARAALRVEQEGEEQR